MSNNGRQSLVNGRGQGLLVDAVIPSYMSTIAEFIVPASEFALRHTLEDTDDLDVEVERVVAYDPEHVMPYVWFAGSDSTLKTLADTLADDPSVEEAERLSDLDGERLYRMNWVDDVTVILHLLTEEQATVLDAHVENRQWRFRVLFPERAALSRTYDFASEQGLSIEIHKIHQLEETRHSRFGLTDAQYETLVAALESGYYEIPRGKDMDELSNELEISHQALSERLRRAHRVLVDEVIDIGESGESGEDT